MTDVADKQRESTDAGANPFFDASGQDDRMTRAWRPFKVSREEILAEVDRLGQIERPANGRRRSYIVHPQSHYNSITPGIRAAIEVVMPGETVEMAPRNSSSVAICIAGSAEAKIDDVDFAMERLDTWSVPNMSLESYTNSGSEPHARLVFSDEPLLEFLNAYYVETRQAALDRSAAIAKTEYHRDPMADYIHELPSGGGALKMYHAFVDPEIVEQRSRVWRWDEVRGFLNQMDKNTEDLRAAIITMYWNPQTGRTHGTTNTITAWMSGGVDPRWTEDAEWDMARSHRHNVAALNYCVAGEWRTIVGDEELFWRGGDLVLTAPSGMAHSNGRNSREAYTFAIQDNSLLAAMNTTIMQEYPDRPAIHLGARRGFHA